MDFEAFRLAAAALVLSVAIGVFAFVPVLVVAISLHVMGITVAGAEWLSQPLTIMVLSVLALTEVLVDSFIGPTHFAEGANVLVKPAIAATVVSMLLPPDKATVITALMAGATTSLTQLAKLKRKFTIGWLPGVNGLFAVVGAVASIGIAVSAMHLFNDAGRERLQHRSVAIAMQPPAIDRVHISGSRGHFGR